MENLTPIEPATTIEQGVAKLEAYNSSQDAAALAEADRRTQGRVSKFIHSGAAGKVLATAGVISGLAFSAAEAPKAVDWALNSDNAPAAETSSQPAEQLKAVQGIEQNINEAKALNTAQHALETASQVEQAQAAVENALIAPVNQVPSDQTGVHVG